MAALEAGLLKRLLERPREDGDPIAGLASTFFAEMQTLIETSWSVAMLDFALGRGGNVRRILRPRSNSVSP